MRTINLFLKSNKALVQMKPGHAVFLLPGILENPKELALTSLSLWREWETIPNDQILSTGAGDITIPVGNWDFVSLANYLSDKFADLGSPVCVCPDLLRLKYTFYPSINVNGSTTTCQKYLGIDSDTDYTGLTESPNRCMFQTVRQIKVFVSVGLHNFSSESDEFHCCNDLLETVDVTAPYGSLISYVNPNPEPVSMFTQADKITVCLTDQDGSYLDITQPWSISLRIKDDDETLFSL